MTTELDVAEAIRDGKAPSGTRYENMWLFAIRITGTGAAYRSGENEYCWRDPSIYSSDRFLARCNGLSVILKHPPKATLDTEQYRDRVVGAIMLPYRKPDNEVWGVARIQDADAAALMSENQLSTSPTVVFKKSNEGITEVLDSGATLLIEPDADLLDHVAICEHGVWDKGGPPTGVDRGDGAVAEKEVNEPNDKGEETVKPKPDAEPVKKPDTAKPDMTGDMLTRMDAMMSRMDAWEAKEQAKADADAAAEKAKADAAAEKAKSDADCATKERMDAIEEKMKERPDSEREEMADAQAKCDSVAAVFGNRAPPPMLAEKPRDYILRTLKPHQQHSAHWKDIPLSALPDAALKIAADQIRADAIAFGSNPSTIPEGELREIRKRVNGHDIVEFQGTFDAGFAPFKRPAQRVSLFDPKHGKAA